jgi:hypothetical protein
MFFAIAQSAGLIADPPQYTGDKTLTPPDNNTGAAKLAAVRYQGEAYRVWLDAAARARIDRLRGSFGGLLGINPTNSVVIRAALKWFEDNLSAIEGPRSLRILREDLEMAARGSERAP